jgi:hypothetical protein
MDNRDSRCRWIDGNNRCKCSTSASRQAGRELNCAPLRSFLWSSLRTSSRLRPELFRCKHAITRSCSLNSDRHVAKITNRSQTGSRVRNEELPFSPRLCPDPELRSPYTTVLNIEPHVHLNIRAGGLSCFASLRDDSLRLWPRQSQELLVVEPPQLPNSGNYPKTIPIFRLHVHADICES